MAVLSQSIQNACRVAGNDALLSEGLRILCDDRGCMPSESKIGVIILLYFCNILTCLDFSN